MIGANSVPTLVVPRFCRKNSPISSARAIGPTHFD
jgi:hypothetical protein